MGILRKFSQVIDRISEFMGWLAMIVVVITIVVGFYNVLARYIGERIGVQLSSNSLIETQWYLFSLVFFLGFSYIMKHGINVRVDFIYAKWPRARQATIDFWGHLCFLVPFCIMGIYVTVNPVLRSWGQLPDGSWGAWELSPDPGGLPRAPIKTMIIIAFAMLLLQTFSELIKLWPVMRGHGDATSLGDTDRPLRIE